MRRASMSRSSVCITAVRAELRLCVLDEQTRLEIERIRRVRNNLVHGVEMLNPADIREDATRLHRFVATLKGEPQKGQAR